MQALEILFTYHGSDLLPHRLAILSNFPETTSPHQYSALLPEAWYALCSLYFLNENFCFMLNIKKNYNLLKLFSDYKIISKLF